MTTLLVLKALCTLRGGTDHMVTAQLRPHKRGYRLDLQGFCDTSAAVASAHLGGESCGQLYLALRAGIREKHDVQSAIAATHRAVKHVRKAIKEDIVHFWEDVAENLNVLVQRRCAQRASADRRGRLLTSQAVASAFLSRLAVPVLVGNGCVMLGTEPPTELVRSSVSASGWAVKSGPGDNRTEHLLALATRYVEGL